MKTRTILKAGAAALMAIASAGCDMDVADKGKLPDVDVTVQPGRVPDIDVHGPQVDARLKDKTVTVPDVDIHKKEVNVKVPDVDVRIPKEEDNEPQRTPPAPRSETAPGDA